MSSAPGRSRSRTRGRAVPIECRPAAPATGVARRVAEADARRFADDPALVEFRRAYVPGETDHPFPPGTTVVVRRCGAQRARAFLPPTTEGVN